MKPADEREALENLVRELVTVSEPWYNHNLVPVDRLWDLIIIARDLIEEINE